MISLTVRSLRPRERLERGSLIGRDSTAPNLRPRTVSQGARERRNGVLPLNAGSSRAGAARGVKMHESKEGRHEIPRQDGISNGHCQDKQSLSV